MKTPIELHLHNLCGIGDYDLVRVGCLVECVPRVGETIFHDRDNYKVFDVVHDLTENKIIIHAMFV